MDQRASLTLGGPKEGWTFARKRPCELQLSLWKADFDDPPASTSQVLEF